MHTNPFLLNIVWVNSYRHFGVGRCGYYLVQPLHFPLWILNSVLGVRGVVYQILALPSSPPLPPPGNDDHSLNHRYPSPWLPPTMATTSSRVQSSTLHPPPSAPYSQDTLLLSASSLGDLRPSATMLPHPLLAPRLIMTMSVRTCLSRCRKHTSPPPLTVVGVVVVVTMATQALVVEREEGDAEIPTLWWQGLLWWCSRQEVAVVECFQIEHTITSKWTEECWISTIRPMVACHWRVTSRIITIITHTTSSTTTNTTTWMMATPTTHITWQMSTASSHPQKQTARCP